MTIQFQSISGTAFTKENNTDIQKAGLIQLAKIHGTPLFVIHESRLAQQYQSLIRALPGVTMHYAIKALADKSVIKSLNKQGCKFDIATSGEIQLLKECGVTADKCIHTHPIKKREDIQDSLDFGCHVFVVDNILELEKFREFSQQAKIIIRVKYNNNSAVVDLAKKFGCEVSELDEMILKSKKWGIDLIGLSFHIGSQTVFPTVHAEAVKSSVELMQNYQNIDWKILDIGGGFPIQYDSSVLDIETYCKPIRDALKLVPESVSVIAEPGRYLVGPVAQHVITIVGKSVRDNKVWYYVDDGVYGAFSGQLYDHAKYPLSVLSDYESQSIFYPSVIAGPTCDSIDVIDEEIMLPDLQIGDQILAEQIGAYSVASATEFNLCKRPKTIFLEK